MNLEISVPEVIEIFKQIQEQPEKLFEMIRFDIRETACLCGTTCRQVPARPECTTPQIRFLYVAPHLWIGLPPDPTCHRKLNPQNF